MPENIERSAPVVDLIYADRESLAYNQQEKVPRFDVIARTSDDRILHIEVQVARDKHLLPRILYYVSKSYISSTQEGGEYSEAQVICIVLLNFIMFSDTQTWYEMHRILNVENGAWRLRGMEFHFIEIPKLRRKLKKEKKWPDTGLERLLYYLGTMGGENEMLNLAAKDSRIEKILELERAFREDKNLFNDYLDWEYEKRHYQSALKDIMAEGQSVGMIKGTVKTLSDLVKDGILTLKDAAARANMSEAEFLAYSATEGE